MDLIINYKSKITNITNYNKPIITIVKLPCMLYIMNIIKDELIKMKWECLIIDTKDINYYINLNNPYHYFLFLFPSQINENVINYKRYILYQLEQNINNQLSINYKHLHETNQLKKIYDNATLLIDYCETNVNVIKKYYSNEFKIMNVPATNKSYEYDIIFVGTVNKKRSDIFNELKKRYKILIIENVYGEELKKLCNKSNICLNIHYYENAILERVRLNEMMEYGIKIISEKPCQEDMDICKYYEGVNFIEMINVDLDLNELFNTIEKIKDYTSTNTNTSSSINLKQLENKFKEDVQILSINKILNIE